MSTQDDAREAILKNIVSEADGASAEGLKFLSEAYANVKKPYSQRNSTDD